jgi:hypothetical protein
LKISGRNGGRKLAKLRALFVSSLGQAVKVPAPEARMGCGRMRMEKWRILSTSKTKMRVKQDAPLENRSAKEHSQVENAIKIADVACRWMFQPMSFKVIDEKKNEKIHQNEHGSSDTELA